MSNDQPQKPSFLERFYKWRENVSLERRVEDLRNEEYYRFLALEEEEMLERRREYEEREILEFKGPNPYDRSYFEYSDEEFQEHVAEPELAEKEYMEQEANDIQASRFCERCDQDLER